MMTMMTQRATGARTGPERACVVMGVMKSRRCHGCGGPIHANNVSGYCSKTERCNRLAGRHVGSVRPSAAYMRQYHADNPEYSMYGSAQSRAKARGINFNITRADILDVYPEACPVLGIPLKRNLRGNSNADSPTLDRIDSTRGYERGNIQVLSNKANRMKSDATPEELLRFADWIYATYKRVT